jgi:arylsulfatase
MRIPSMIVFAAVALVHPINAQDAPAAQRPNVVVILADDLGYSDLGCYGSEIPTPNLDRLAAGGLRFTQFYNNARCCPSRAALLTGLYPHQAGVGGMIDNYARAARDQLNSPAYSDHLSPSCPTIAQVLRSAGYRTLMCGKWHLGYRPAEWPVRRGFDRSLVQIDGAMNFFGPGVQHQPGRRPPMALDDRPYDPPDEGFFSTDAFSDRAAEWITDAANANTPFFLYLAYNAPHWPLHAPDADVAKHRGKYRAGFQAVRAARHKRQLALGVADERWGMAPMDRGRVAPWDQLSEAERDEWDLKMAVYAAQVERMDAGIGRVLDAVRRAGVERDTLVLFLSDNGGAAENPNKSKPGAVTGTRDSYAGYARPWATVSNTPLRLHKQRVHEGGISAPAIAYWPGRIAKPGSITHQVGHIVDVMATCLDVAGAAHPSANAGSAPPPEGTSLAPVLAGRELPERALFWEHEGSRAVRRGHWKLVAVPGGAWELYDVAADRAELKDLASQHPEHVARLEAEYKAWADRCGVLPWPGAARAR